MKTLPPLLEPKSSVAVCEFAGWIYAVGGHTVGDWAMVWIQVVERLDTRDDAEGWVKIDLVTDENSDKTWDAMSGHGICGISEQELLIFGRYNGHLLLAVRLAMSIRAKLRFHGE